MFPGILHLENDMFHMKNGLYSFDQRQQRSAVDWCMNTCLNALTAGMDVAVSNTFTRKRFVQAYIDTANYTGADVIVYRLNGDFKNTHSVPVNVYESMKNGFEDWPGEIIVTPDGNTYSFSSS